MAEDHQIELTLEEVEEFLTCKPLYTYRDIQKFLENPPLWRTLCKELITRHSQSKIRNMDIIDEDHEILVEFPETFCHSSPDTEDPKRHLGHKLPKTLVCHDMANGYHDDSFIDGTTAYDSYTFYNWAGIDIFCYFSHHLITIPPLGWINVGHEHGVKVIGTVITERAEGMLFWDKILASEIEYQNFASALVAIASTLKFDGWLLNVENKITRPDILLEFVRYLSDLLHREIPHAELIWYDSVTVCGNLNWQNGLNDKNRAFFDACDGLFTNYCWNEFDLTSSAIEAGERLTDLYVGIDVWGRNFYGGGEFNTQDAMKLVYKTGCSYAIFAPAWTHEAMSVDQLDTNFVTMGQHMSSWQRFLLRDRALWGSFWPFLHTRLPCALPFQTSFCKGQGTKKWHCGEVVSPGPWYNLRHQQYQPNSSHGPHGYILSSHEAILAHSSSCTFLPQRPHGIIRYRESYTAHLQTMEDLHIGGASCSDRLINEQKEQEMSLETSTLTRLKRRVIDSIRNIFRHCPSKSLDRSVQTGETASKRDVDSKSLKSADFEPMESKPKDFKAEVSKLGESKLGELKLEESMIRKSEESKPGESNPGESKPGQSEPEESKLEEPTTGKSEESKPGEPEPEEPKLEESITRKPEESKPGESKPGELNTGKSRQDEVRSKHEETTEPLPGTSQDERQIEDRRDTDDDVMRSSGKSMVSISLNIQLGHGRQTAWPRLGLAHVHDERECLEVWLQDAFSGGSCLRVHPSDPVVREHRQQRLFHCDFECADSLVVCVVTKTEPEFGDQHLNVNLHMRSELGHAMDVELSGKRGASRGGVQTVPPLEVADQSFKDLQKYLLVHEPNFYVPVENPFGWLVRYHEVQFPGGRVTSVNLKTELEKGPILLGHFGICYMSQRLKKDTATDTRS